MYERRTKRRFDVGGSSTAPPPPPVRDQYPRPRKHKDESIPLFDNFDDTRKAAKSAACRNREIEDCWGQNRSRRNRCPKVLRKTESRSKLQKPRKRIAETDRPASSTMTRASSPGEHDRVAGRLAGEHDRVAGRLAGELGRDTSQLARRARPCCRSTRR